MVIVSALALLGVGCSALRPGAGETAWASLLRCDGVERQECLRRAGDTVAMQTPWKPGLTLRANEVRADLACLTRGSETPLCNVAPGWEGSPSKVPRDAKPVHLDVPSADDLPAGSMGLTRPTLMEGTRCGIVVGAP